MTARAHPSFALRPFLPADAALLAEIFRASIEELTGDDYSEAQQAAWAAAADDEDAFSARLGDQLTLVATLDGSPIGFASLALPDEVDLLYVHPTVAGHGAGSLLLDALERLAGSRGAARLTADVSDSARDFFAGRGYQPQRRNTVSHHGEWLANTTMEKPLQAERAAQARARQGDDR
jgi:putative acetyltransferase